MTTSSVGPSNLNIDSSNSEIWLIIRSIERQDILDLIVLHFFEGTIDSSTFLLFFLHFNLMVVVSVAFWGKYEVNGSADLLECLSVSTECVTHFMESKYLQNLFVFPFLPSYLSMLDFREMKILYPRSLFII